MLQIKTYQTLHSMTVVELNRFNKFVHSPYFNVNKELTVLYKIFEEDIRSTKKRKIPLTKSNIWSKIYPKAKFNDKNFRKLNSSLLKLLQSFLAQEEYESNSLHKANYLLQAISRRRFELLYNSSFAQARRLSEIQYERPPSYYFYLFQLEKANFQLTSSHDKKEKLRKTKSDDVFDIEIQSKYLDLYYIAEKLRHLCYDLNSQKFRKKKTEIIFKKEILDQIPKIEFEKYPIIAVYYQIYLSITVPDDLDHYYKLKELVHEHIDKFPPDIVTEIFEYTLNYCIQKINSKVSFYEETLNTYLYGLESGYILKNGELSPTSFRNICSVGFRLGNHLWVYEFINKYQHFLSEASRNNAVIYNLGRYYFHIKDYKSVIEKLRDVTYDDYAYELISKNTLIMTYYEMKEFDTLDSFLTSFRTFINRHKKIPEQRRIRYVNLIKIVKKMISIVPGNKNSIEGVKTDLKKFKVVANKKWIEEKLNEL